MRQEAECQKGSLREENNLWGIYCMQDTRLALLTYLCRVCNHSMEFFLNELERSKSAIPPPRHPRPRLSTPELVNITSVSFVN